MNFCENFSKMKIKPFIIWNLQKMDNYHMYHRHGVLNSDQVSHMINSGCSLFLQYCLIFSAGSCLLQTDTADTWVSQSVDGAEPTAAICCVPWAPSSAPPLKRHKPGESLTPNNPWVLLLCMLTDMPTNPASASGGRQINMKRSVCTHCTVSALIHRITSDSFFIIYTQKSSVT